MRLGSPQRAARLHGISVEELLAMAEYLGVDCTGNEELTDAVALACIVSLPEGWTQHLDPSTGQLYWHNVAGRSSTWEHPDEDALFELLPSAEAVGDDCPAARAMAESLCHSSGSDQTRAAAAVEAAAANTADDFVGFMETQLSQRVVADAVAVAGADKTPPATTPPRQRIQLAPIPTLAELQAKRAAQEAQEALRMGGLGVTSSNTARASKVKGLGAELSNSCSPGKSILATGGTKISGVKTRVRFRSESPLAATIKASWWSMRARFTRRHGGGGAENADAAVDPSVGCCAAAISGLDALAGGHAGDRERPGQARDLRRGPCACGSQPVLLHSPNVFFARHVFDRSLDELMDVIDQLMGRLAG
jgi:hypothetical protein